MGFALYRIQKLLCYSTSYWQTCRPLRVGCPAAWRLSQKSRCHRPATGTALASASTRAVTVTASDNEPPSEAGRSDSDSGEFADLESGNNESLWHCARISGWRPCGVGTSSLVAIAGGWVNKTSSSTRNDKDSDSDRHQRTAMIQDSSCHGQYPAGHCVTAEDLLAITDMRRPGVLALSHTRRRPAQAGRDWGVTDSDFFIQQL